MAMRAGGSSGREIARVLGGQQHHYPRSMPQCTASSAN
jgi:hypothetical protein